MTKIKCPAPDCDAEIDEDDLLAQKAHMEAEHPEIIADRLRREGFVWVDGRWVDLLASDD